MSGMLIVGVLFFLGLWRGAPKSDPSGPVDRTRTEAPDGS